MSKLHNEEQWGNLTLPESDLSPEDLLRSDVNRIIANRRSAKDPDWLAANKNGQKIGAVTRSNSQKFRDGTSRGAKNRMKSEEGKANIKKMCEHSTGDANWRKNHSALQKERYKDPTNNPNYRGAAIGTNIKTGEIIVLAGATEIKKAGFSGGNISQCINGKRKSYKGYTWRREQLETNPNKKGLKNGR